MIRRKMEEATQSNLKSAKESKGELLKFVLFVLDNESYAFPIESVSEIVMLSEITPVPGAPDYVLGLMDLRGEIIPVIDLERRFGLVRETSVAGQHIIVIRSNKYNFGIRVDAVSGIIESALSDLQASPEAIKSKVSAEVIERVGIYNEQVFVVLNALKIISVTEQEKVLTQVEMKQDNNQSNEALKGKE